MSASRILAALVLTLGATTQVAAQGRVLPPCPRTACAPGRPCPPCPRPGNWIERTRSDARVRLESRTLFYEIDEEFVNRGGAVGEAEYLLPLPRNAAFGELALYINGEPVTGEALPADRARSIYERIVNAQRDPALVEMIGHGLLRARIFPIAPGERKRVTVRFHAVAEREGDALRIEYYRGPRATPVATPRRRDDDVIPERIRGETFELRYRDRDLGRAYSPTHSVRTETHGDWRVVRVAEGGGDVTVLVPLMSSGGGAIGILTNARRGEGHALITFSPPASNAPSIPRDVTFVVDVSGSMRGEKIEQVRRAGISVLRSLRAGDRFRIVAFSSDTREFAGGFSPVSRETVRAAERFVDRLQADGGTNIEGALEAALAEPSRGSRLPLLLFLTDGLPTVGARNADSLAALVRNRRANARVFTFGVGSDVSVPLLEQLAMEGRGTAQFVRQEESVERAVDVLASRLSQPVMTDVRIRVRGVEVRDAYPRAPIDVFAGQDLVVLARYEGDGPAAIELSGESDGRPVTFRRTVSFARDDRRNSFVPRLWAVRRIGHLVAEWRRGDRASELADEIRRLGEQYGLPTELTSYLVLEPGMAPDRLITHQQQRRGRVGDFAGSGAGAPMAPPPPPPPPPPPAATGAAAFESARAASTMRDATRLEEVSVASSGSTGTRGVAGRSFELADGVWRQVSPRAQRSRTVTVKAFSTAYFALIDHVPELREIYALGDRVVVHGRSLTLVVDENGSERLSDDELERIARDW